ncbi:hypothetical protein F5B21DRAFT_406873 [Xylaria acuta]|nr:hypothetical protein F5B21DRAFT_406873 [Xylaria acuta]
MRCMNTLEGPVLGQPGRPRSPSKPGQPGRWPGRRLGGARAPWRPDSSHWEVSGQLANGRRAGCRRARPLARDQTLNTSCNDELASPLDIKSRWARVWTVYEYRPSAAHPARPRGTATGGHLRRARGLHHQLHMGELAAFNDDENSDRKTTRASLYLLRSNGARRRRWPRGSISTATATATATAIAIFHLHGTITYLRWVLGYRMCCSFRVLC